MSCGCEKVLIFKVFFADIFQLSRLFPAKFRGFFGNWTADGLIYCMYFILLYPESIEWFIEKQGFSPSYDLAPRPTPPPISCQQVVSLAQYSSVSRWSSLLTRKGRRGWGRSQIIWRREGPVRYKSVSTLWWLYQYLAINSTPFSPSRKPVNLTFEHQHLPHGSFIIPIRGKLV